MGVYLYAGEESRWGVGGSGGGGGVIPMAVWLHCHQQKRQNYSSEKVRIILLSKKSMCN